MNRTRVYARGAYRDQETTINAAVRVTSKGRKYLEISKRQISDAGKRCCYAGTDYPVIGQVDGYTDWDWCKEGSLVCYELQQ